MGICYFNIAMNTFQQVAAFPPRSPPHKHLWRLFYYNVKYLSEHVEQGSGSKTAGCASRRARRQCGFVRIYSHGSKYIDYTRFNPYPTAFPYGNGMVLHFYQQQESSTTKTVHKVINKGLKTYV